MTTSQLRPLAFAAAVLSGTFAAHCHRLDGQASDKRAVLGVTVQNVAISMPLLDASLTFIARHRPLLRTPIYWPHVEKQRGSYSIPIRYQVLRKLGRGSQRRLVIVLGYNNPLYSNDCRLYPRYTRGTQCIAGISSEEEISGFIGYASYLAKEFGSDVAIWEIWNEENAKSFWLPTPNISHYRQLLNAVAPKLKALAPSSRVITGGAADLDFDFIDSLLAGGVPTAVDGIGIHMNSVRPGFVPSTVGGRIVELPLRTALNRLDSLFAIYQKPFYVTEFGYELYSPAYDTVPSIARSSGALHDVDQRAIGETFEALAEHPAIAVAIIFQLQDDLQRRDRGDAIRGLIDFQGRPKPATQYLDSVLR